MRRNSKHAAHKNTKKINWRRGLSVFSALTLCTAITFSTKTSLADEFQLYDINPFGELTSATAGKANTESDGGTSDSSPSDNSGSEGSTPSGVQGDGLDAEQDVAIGSAKDSEQGTSKDTEGNEGNEGQASPEGTQQDPFQANPADLTLQALPGVAIARGVEHATLSDAFAAAPANTETTVRLTADIVMTTGDIATVQSDQNIILDMDGHSITVTSDFAGRPINNYGTLKVIGNGTIDSSASVTGGWGAINNFGTLEIDSGRFKGSKWSNGSAIKNRPGSSAYFNGGYYEGTCALYNEGNVEINKGEFNSTICSECDGNWAHTVNNIGNANINIDSKSNSDVKISGNHGGLSLNDNTDAVINGGTFTTVPCANNHVSATYSALHTNGEGSWGTVNCTINGGNFYTAGEEGLLLIQQVNYSRTNLTINAGTFSRSTNTIALFDGDSKFNLTTRNIRGGTFQFSKSAVRDQELFAELRAQNGDGQTLDDASADTNELHLHSRLDMGDVSPTCIANGSIGGARCKLCNATLVEPSSYVPALGHSFSSWTVRTPAAVGIAGVEARECTRADCPKDGTHIETREWRRCLAVAQVDQEPALTVMAQAATLTVFMTALPTVLAASARNRVEQMQVIWL